MIYLKHKNISVLGTNHIAKQSVNEIKQTIKELKPDIVCLELDSQRYNSLMSNKKQGTNISPAVIKIIGVKGYLFALIGGFIQRQLSKKTGYKPGSDMKSAAKLAKKNNAKILLIDQPIQKTLWNISHRISKQDKKNFWSDLGWIFLLTLLRKKLFFSIFRSKKIKEKIYTRVMFLGTDVFNINTVPNQDMITQMMIKVKHVYPSVYKILVDDRNKYMATNLHNIMLKHPKQKVVAIVGAGHVTGMIDYLQKYDKGDEK